MSSGPPHDTDPRSEDWLAEEGDVDWADTAESVRAQGGTGAAASAGGAGAEGTFRDDLIQRRRLVALGAIGFAVLVLIIILVVVFSGGDKTETPPPTQPTQTAPPPPPPPAQTTPVTPAITVTVPEGGTLSSGDTGDEVKNLQKALIALELDAGKADGDFGPSTEAAVIEFQKQNDLAQDGVVGKKTADAINAALAQQG